MVGAGVIGLELGSVWRRLGSEVTVVEFLDRITPGMDLEIAKAFQRILTKQGMTFQLSTKVTGVEKTKSRPGGDGRAGGGRREKRDRDRRHAGRHRAAALSPTISAWTRSGVALDKRGRVITDAHYQHQCAGHLCRRRLPRRPDAGAQGRGRSRGGGRDCIAGKAGHVNYDAIPSVIYTFPEVATVGKTEEELKAAGVAYKVGKFPFTANARAKTILATEGFVKILADAKTDRVLGCHIIGPGSGQSASPKWCWRSSSAPRRKTSPAPAIRIRP